MNLSSPLTHPLLSSFRPHLLTVTSTATPNPGSYNSIFFRNGSQKLKNGRHFLLYLVQKREVQYWKCRLPKNPHFIQDPIRVVHWFNRCSCKRTKLEVFQQICEWWNRNNKAIQILNPIWLVSEVCCSKLLWNTILHPSTHEKPDKVGSPSSTWSGPFYWLIITPPFQKYQADVKASDWLKLVK